jgi:two-component system chemotaxis response regulator CheB
MWELDEQGLARYRCHTGHAYTAELMSLAVDDSLRRAFATALRALGERSAMVRRLHEQAMHSGRTEMAATLARREREFDREAAVIEEAITRLDQMAARSVPQ